MKNFIFDVLKMYIEFLLYNYQEVKWGWIILCVIFAMIMTGFLIYSIEIENEETMNFSGYSVFVLLAIIAIFGILYPSQETLQYVLTSLITIK